MPEKIEKLKELVSEKQAIFITDNYNRRYITGLQTSAGLLVVTNDRCCFLVDSRYFEIAKSKIEHCEVLLSSDLIKDAKDIVDDGSVKTVLLEHDIKFSFFEKIKQATEQLEFLPSKELTETLNSLRMTKNEKEISAIKKAQTIADNSFSELLKFFKEGVSEQEIAARLEYIMRINGSQKASFETIVLFGERTSMPHGRPSENKLKQNDIILLDFGATIEGYCSDMTRTLFIGEASTKQQQVYNTVVSAKNKAIKSIRSGEYCQKIDGVAREHIENSQFKGLFGHGLGHSVGLEIHELPAFSPVSKDVVDEGYIMTVEPGIYIEKQFGVRVEDIGVVEKSGFSVFTGSTEQLIVL